MIPRGKVKDKRNAILVSTLELISQQGFHGTSMKQIAVNANVAAGTIYVYFTSKEDLIIELFTEIRKELNEVIYGGFDHTADFKGNFMVLWNEVLKYYLEYPLKYIFMEQFSNSPFIYNMDLSEGVHALAPAYSLFEEARSKGVLKNLPISALLALTHGPIISLVRMNNMREIDIKAQINFKDFAEASWESISN